MVYTLRFFPLQNAVSFIILTYLVPVLFTFYLQNVLKLNYNNSGAKRLNNHPDDDSPLSKHVAININSIFVVLTDGIL